MEIVFQHSSRVLPGFFKHETRESQTRLVSIPQLQTVCRTNSAQRISLSSNSNSIGTELRASPTVLDTDLYTGHCGCINLLLGAFTTSDLLALVATVTVVQCERRERQEPRSLLSERPAERRPGAARSIVRPELPPEFEDEGLEDRIRMLLAPPISVELDTIALEHEPKDFQAIGVQWLIDRKSALLADEMGLGKTMQAILAARMLWRQKEVENILIVCPSPLVDNWRREIKSWWGSIAGANMDVWSSSGSNKMRWLKMCTNRHIVKIISYPMLAR